MSEGMLAEITKTLIPKPLVEGDPLFELQEEYARLERQLGRDGAMGEIRMRVYLSMAERERREQESFQRYWQGKEGE